MHSSKVASPKPSAYIRAALAVDPANLLTFGAFIAATNYPVDPFMLDHLWTSLWLDIPIYADDAFIKWLGHTAAKKENRKKALLKTMARFKAGVDWFDHPNDLYRDARLTILAQAAAKHSADSARLSISAPVDHSALFPNPPAGQGSHNTKHLLLASHCLRAVMLDTTTDRADPVRAHYWAVMAAAAEYDHYKAAFAARQHPAPRPNAEEKQTVPTSAASIPAPTDRIYVLTSPKLAAENYYRVGGAICEDELTERLAEYNAPRTEPYRCHAVFIAECYDHQSVEALFWTAYGRFRDVFNPDTELIRLHIDDILVGIRAAIIAQNAVVEPIMHNYDALARRTLDTPRILPAIAANSAPVAAPRYKKRHIPKTLKDSVWDYYIGKDRGSGNCFICAKLLDSKHFECGHVEAECNGGATVLANLRPVCSLCNKSVGAQNMTVFKATYFAGAASQT